MIDVYLAVGHGLEPNGVFDPGAVNPVDHAQEHTLNTAVCTSAAAALTRAGAQVVWESNAGAGHDVDYRGSTEAINQIQPRCAVEVHFDTSVASPGGFGLWVSEAGMGLALSVSGRWIEEGLPVKPNTKRTDLWLLNATKCTALIWECDPVGEHNGLALSRMGEAIAAGICDYLGISFTHAVNPDPGGPVSPSYPFTIADPHVVDWAEVDGLSWILTSDGSIFAGPHANAIGAGIPGVNGHPEYFAGRMASKLHVRKEGDRYVGTVEDTTGHLYREPGSDGANGGPPFRTH